MNDTQLKIKEFKKRWAGRGNEKQETQSFWNELLFALGAEEPTRRIFYEKPVKIRNGKRVTQKYIDAYIPETKVLIEQKDKKVNLNKPARQSDGVYLTPYEQGKRYGQNLGHSEFPRWIVVSNFDEIRVHDNDKPGEAPYIIKLNEIEKDYTRLSFLLSSKNEHLEKEKELSLKASELIGRIYNELLENNDNNPELMESLNILAVRLTFLLYAEDAGLLYEPLQFYNYMNQFRDNPDLFAMKLEELFEVLDQKDEERYKFLDIDLSKFPYINGALFKKNSDIKMPKFNKSIIDMLLDKASLGFNWSSISPTIFGASFESTLNAETRHDGGMHYTSLENIHKVIDPLFLDDLNLELNEILNLDLSKKVNKDKLDSFHDKIASLQFLDPACGSGNFLTETFLSLKKLENKIIEAKLKGQIGLLTFNEDLIKVTLDQFHGIEINDWAVSVAKTALWIAEHQALKETQRILRADIDFLPLSSYSGIVEGNALRIDWKEIVKPYDLNYIIGNPPFLGYSQQNKKQKADLKSVYVNEKGKPYPRTGKIDFVAGWFFKASEFIQNTDIKVAFVATNSITQGDQVAPIWKPLIQRFNIHIDFAYKTFIWNNESKDKAQVHVVIIGYSKNNKNGTKKLYSKSGSKEVDFINPYLLPIENIFIEKIKKPISNIPEAITGNRPTDGGNLIIEASDYQDFIKKEPKAKKFIKNFIGGAELIKGNKRYCLWLVNATPKELKSMPLTRKRIEACKDFRLKSTKLTTQKSADTPYLFQEIRCMNQSCLAIPLTSGDNRRYIPLDFIDSNSIASNALLIVPDAELFHFSVLTSNVHNAWMRAFAGRLGVSYRYSTDIYNSFVFPELTEEVKERLNKTGKAILDARALYPDSSLADLYDPLTMPPELLKAHRANDRTVMEAYGWNWRGMTEEDAVAELMKLYKEKTK